MIYNHKYLVDGKYSFKDLVDIDHLRVMLEQFSQATGFTTGLVSYPDQELLIDTGWRDICINFHRVVQDSEVHCIQSNLELTAGLNELKMVNIHHCKNGLVEGATPIIIKGAHVGSLLSGQILFSEPDVERFRKQGKAYGYDVDAYLEALGKVPVVTEEDFKKALVFLCEMVVMLAERGLIDRQNRESAQAAWENETKLCATLNSIGDAVITTDTEGNLVQMNPVAENLTGWSFKKEEGKPLTEVFNITQTEMREAAENPVNKVLESGKTVELAKHTMLISKDGTEYQIAGSCTPIKNVDGNITGMVLVFRNMTEEFRIHENLRESEEKYRSLIETMEEGIGLVDENEMFTFVNQAASNIFGFTKDEMIGKNMKELTTPEIFRQVLKETSLRKKGESSRYELTILRKNGEKRIIIVIVTPKISKDGIYKGALGIFYDITERKKAEEELAHRIELERIIQKLSFDFVGCTAENFDSVIDSGLAHLGEFFDIDRVYVFQNDLDQKTINNTHKWCSEGIEPQIKNLKSIPFSALPSFIEQLEAFKDIHIPSVADLPESWQAEREILEAQDIQSLVIVPISNNHDLLGFIGFDVMRFKRIWKKEEIALLRLVGNLIGNVFYRKRAEEALTKSEEKYRYFFENSPMGITSFNHKGDILAVNENMLNILGSPSAEATRQINIMTFPPLVEVGFTKCYKQCLENGNLIDVDFNYTSKWRKNVDLHCILSPIHDTDENIVGVHVIFEDITERKRVEEALRESNMRNEALLAAMPEMMFVLTKNGTYVDFKAEMEDELAIPPGEIIGKNLSDTGFSEDKVKFFLEQIEDTLKTGNTHSFEYELKTHTTDNFYDACIVPFGKDKILATVRNITEKKKAEEELRKLQKLESVGTLAGGIAHNFNNILMGLFGNISIAKMKLSKDHPAFKSLEEAENAMSRATSLARQLLTFAKGGEPVREDVSLGEIVREVTGFDLSGSNVMPVFELADDLWIAKVDKGQVQEVFSNLTINANQAMPDGGHLYITLENIDISKNASLNLNPGKYIKATVRDEGIGINQKHLDWIFDPYFSTKQAGSGLGLATVYSIINKHGGHISANSELGKGTIFTLYLPASESRQLPETKQPEAEPSILGQTAKILVMDDEEMIRDVSTEMLEKCGFTADSAVDGKEAMGKYISADKNGYPFDIVIMDLTIPGGMGGKEALKELLTIDSEAKVIVSSGYSTDPVMANYSKYGFKGKLIKPFQIEDLKKELTRVMKIG